MAIFLRLWLVLLPLLHKLKNLSWKLVCTKMVTLLDQQICWRTNVLDLEPSLYNRTHTQVHLFPACKAFFSFLFLFFYTTKENTYYGSTWYIQKQAVWLAHFPIWSISKSLTTMQPIDLPASFQWLMSSSRIESLQIIWCFRVHLGQSHHVCESPPNCLLYSFLRCQHSRGVSQFSYCLYCSLYLD